MSINLLLKGQRVCFHRFARGAYLPRSEPGKTWLSKKRLSAVRVYSSSSREDNHQHKWRPNATLISTAAGVGVTLGLVGWMTHRKEPLLAEKRKGAQEKTRWGREVKGIPFYSSEEVGKHNAPEKRIWVSYKSGVYDVTDFVKRHPGGDKILMASGGALEPFWALYAVHKTDQVFEMLEELRIGNLSPEDRETGKGANDPYAADPRRHPALKAASTKPFNAEPPPLLLVESFLTPNDLFFVRNHLPVPEVDEKEYRLEIKGQGLKKSYSLTLKELKTLFKKHTITATIQCAGNRRAEMIQVKEVKGLPWTGAAISTAKWSGPKLVDVLKHLGADLNDDQIKHVQFEGLDLDPAALPYGASVPSEIALDPKSDLLLAYEMNGEDIPRDHGYPVRLIAPGIVGARNVKWLSKIVLSHEESHSHWQRNDYKGFSPNTDLGNVDFNTAPAIQMMPVQSAICDPREGEEVKLEDNKWARVRGYAWSGGGSKIIRVDVSPDGGKSWINADLQQEPTSLYRTWSWTLWEVKVPLDGQQKAKQVELVCKAVDSSYNCQPEAVDGIWNFRGVVSNAWHRVRVVVSK